MNKIENITRQNIYDLVYSELGLSKNLCSNFVDDIFSTIISGLQNEKKVKISLFGTFVNVLPYGSTNCHSAAVIMVLPAPVDIH